MKSDSGRTKSSWMLTSDVGGYARLDSDSDADVVVIGGGIAGLTTAYLLAKEGRSVVLLEDGDLGSGETGRTTAHLTSVLDRRYSDLVELHGAERARLAASSHVEAIDRIEAIAREESIDCAFARVDGYLFGAPTRPADELDRELEAAHRVGLDSVHIEGHAPLGPFDTGRCLVFPRQAQFHPLRYLDGLARAIVRHGGRIFTSTHAAEIKGGDSAVVTTADGHKITTRSVVVATNTPVNDMVAIHTKQAPYRTYAVGLTIPHGSVPTALFWDTAEPYHYVRIQPIESTPGMAATHDLLVVGGEDHKTGQADDTYERFDRLVSWARERIPTAGDVMFRWSGQVMEPVDGLAYIGRNPMDDANVFVATGASGNGMTYGTIAGILITDLVVGRLNAWEGLYSPSRVSTRSIGTFVEENVNVAGQYLDLVTPGEVDSGSEIEPGSGAIVRRGLTKIAMFRDEGGVIHERSAICPHLGCVVAWNQLESSWDCPCHGSRFDACGTVVNGPANVDLARLDDE